jgi:hypothetical protein
MDMSSKFKATQRMLNLENGLSLEQHIEKLSGSNTTTMSMRIELYVKEQLWKKSNCFSQEFLFTFICAFEGKISKMILFWNENRLAAFENHSKEYVDDSCFILRINSFENKCDTLYDPVGLGLEKAEMLNCLANAYEKNTKFNFSKDILPCPNNSRSNLVHLLDKEVIQKSNFFCINMACKSSANSLPMYIISTRDCFVFDLFEEKSLLEFEGKKIIRKEFFFSKHNFPSNYEKFKTTPDDFRVGAVTYENFFSHEELNEIEHLIEKTEQHSMLEVFLPETAQKTLAGEKLKRTKFFFGSRYMWTKKQLAEPNSYVAAGIRKDVSPPPFWIKNKVENPLIKAGIILKDFINSYALNVYHDGTEGLGQHFDDAVRFKQVNLIS